MTFIESKWILTSSPQPQGKNRLITVSCSPSPAGPRGRAAGYGAGSTAGRLICCTGAGAGAGAGAGTGAGCGGSARLTGGGVGGCLEACTMPVRIVGACPSTSTARISSTMVDVAGPSPASSEKISAVMSFPVALRCWWIIWSSVIVSKEPAMGAASTFDALNDCALVFAFNLFISPAVSSVSRSSAIISVVS